MKASKKKVVEELIEQARNFRSCGPSDDPDEQTAVTTGYRYLVVQFKRLAGPILPEGAASRLDAIDVEVDNLYSAYDAKAELDALLPDIEAALEILDGTSLGGSSNLWIVHPQLVSQIAELEVSSVDLLFPARICREINSSYAHGNILATALLMRTVLNHVPPVFGNQTFDQVVANAGKSLKDSFDHLQSGLRKVADFHAHRKITAAESYPSIAQVEPFKPQFELLLQQVMARIGKG